MAKMLTAKDLANHTDLSARYFRLLASRGVIPGAVQPSGRDGAWRFDATSGINRTCFDAKQEN